MVFPLSVTHYMEIAKIADPAQRQDLAVLMEELSGFTALLARTVVMRLELEATLDTRIGPSPDPLPELDLVGPGFGWAIGQLHRIVIEDDAGNDATDEVRQQVGASLFDAQIRAAWLTTERKMLAGPPDEDVPRLQAMGWDPRAAQRVAEDRARQEEELQGKLDDQTRRPALLRRTILGREAFIELDPMLTEAARARNCRAIHLLGGNSEQAQTLVRSMPSSEVATILKFEDHRNSSKRWLPNDIFDIDALSLAVPYCDIVVTDLHRRQVLRRTRIGDRTETIILAKLDELLDHL